MHFTWQDELLKECISLINTDAIFDTDLANIFVSAPRKAFSEITILKFDPASLETF